MRKGQMNLPVTILIGVIIALLVLTVSYYMYGKTHEGVESIDKTRQGAKFEITGQGLERCANWAEQPSSINGFNMYKPWEVLPPIPPFKACKDLYDLIQQEKYKDYLDFHALASEQNIWAKYSTCQTVCTNVNCLKTSCWESYTSKADKLNCLSKKFKEKDAGWFSKVGHCR
jgi:hypothetical protein